MLTKKEKYTEALGYLFNHAHNCTNCDRVNICCDDCEKDNTMECDIAYVRLDNLIEEHFDNPPLKFDDLKPGTIVWDNGIHLYRNIKDIDPYAGTVQFSFGGI